MKNLAIIIFFSIFLTSCGKNAPVPVVYVASGAVSEFSVFYTDAGGNLQKMQVSPQSGQDAWKYSFSAEQGDIVYLSGKYKDAFSALNLMIKVNGKVYKQAYSEGDTLHYLTVSGVIPYD